MENRPGSTLHPPTSECRVSGDHAAGEEALVLLSSCRLDLHIMQLELEMET
jgi:hypothetical protein